MAVVERAPQPGAPRGADGWTAVDSLSDTAPGNRSLLLNSGFPPIVSVMATHPFAILLSPAAALLALGLLRLLLRHARS
jgi:hypothetical protein